MTPLAADDTQYVPDVQAPAAGASAPARIGRYRVLALLGRGATGSVYRAHDEALGRTVAIKLLHPGSDPAVRARFLNEARAIGSVLHPHILAVFDTGSDAMPYLVMELARGSLRDAMRARTIDPEGVRRAGIQIARALAAAHAANIVHRDVKPANILATAEDVWKLADFGIARLPDSELTDTGQFLGSPSYAAPESLRAGQFTPASDVYALAATLYEAYAGAPTHGDHDMPSVVRKLEHDPPPLHLRCAVPRTVAAAIMDALSRDPAARPSAGDLARRLAASDDAAFVPPPSPRIARLAIASALAAAGLLGVAIATRVQDPRAPREAASPAPSFASGRDPGEVAGAPPPVPAQPPTVGRPTPDPPAAAPAAPAAPDAPADLGATELADPGTAEPAPAPRFDADGNLVDDETARAMLEALERDARGALDGVRRPARRGRRWRWRGD